MNSRERQVRAARRLISDAQLIAFLRAVRGSGDLFAVELINEDLDNGESLDEIFYTRNEYGYLLSVRKLPALGLLISFGCQAGPADQCGQAARILKPERCFDNVANPFRPAF